MAVTSFIPEIWAARLLEHLDKAHVYAALMNRDYEGEIRNAGDTVHINTIGDITVDDYDGTAITYEALSTTSQDLKIDQAKYFAFGVDDVEKATQILIAEGCVISVNPVQVISVPNKSGGLNDLLGKIAQANIDIEYMYSTVDGKDDEAKLVFKVDKPDELEKII